MLKFQIAHILLQFEFYGVPMYTLHEIKEKRTF